jgi:hypothetical protein
MEQSGTFAQASVLNPQQDVTTPPAKTFTEYKTVFTTLLSNFKSGEASRVTKRREFRRHVVNVGEMRASNPPQLLADETCIPDRTCDTNIRNTKPPFIRYLTEPTTVLSFVDAANPFTNFQPLSAYYTDINRTPGWQLEWFLLADAILTHGTGYLEVVPSANKVGTDVQYIRRDHLVFPENTRSLNAAGNIIRILEFTKAQFDDFAKANSFNPTVTEVVSKHMEKRDTFTKIYRVYLREEGIIKMAYFADDETGAADWLRAPAPYSLGELTAGADGKPITVPLKVCPIIPFPFELEEDEEILKIQGRVALDAHIQDALTAVISSTVNTAYRASGFYPTKEDPESAGRPAEQVSFKHGMLHYGKINMQKLDWPNAIAISLAQFLRTTGAAQAGAVDYAAMNRVDTAKTAYEIQSAKEEASKLSSMSVTLFALCSLQVELLRWNVWLSLVRHGARPMPAFAVPSAPDQPAQIQLFSPTLVPTMSADQQVVRQAELSAKYLQYMPLVVGTPYHMPMLESMLTDAFPLHMQNWKQQANMLAMAQQAAMGHMQTLAAAFQQLRVLDISGLPPEEQQTMAQLLNELGAYLQQNAPQQPQQ